MLPDPLFCDVIRYLNAGDRRILVSRIASLPSHSQSYQWPAIDSQINAFDLIAIDS